jgi:hypothetical protein
MSPCKEPLSQEKMREKIAETKTNQTRKRHQYWKSGSMMGVWFRWKTCISTCEDPAVNDRQAI